MNLFCKKCNKLLTLSSLKESTYDELTFIDEKELLNENNYILASEAEILFEIPIKYLIHTNSISLIDHPDKQRFSGCCGTSQFSKLNQVCPQCGFEIGVLINDCWTPKFIGLDIHKVSLKPLW